MQAPAPNQLDFLPDDYLAGRARARANRLYSALLTVVIVGVGGGFVVAERSLDDLRAEHAAVVAEFEREATRIERFRQLQQRQAAVDARAALAAALVEKLPRTRLLAEVADALPAGVALTDFTLVSKARAAKAAAPADPAAKRRAAKTAKSAKADAAPPKPQPKTYDVMAKVGGVARSDAEVAAAIGNFSRSTLFRDVTLIQSRQATHLGEPVKKFEVELVLTDNPPAPVAAPKMAAVD